MIDGLFLADYQADPFYNMALDEYLFESVIAGNIECCLRIYSWQTATITFGLNQQEEKALDWSQVGETPVIRRVTGGRALLHDPDELTYCFAANLASFDSESGPTSSRDLFRRVADSLVIFLEHFGIDANYARASASSDSSPVKNQKSACFASHSRFEILNSNRKIIASAQRVVGNSVIQHGSIKWHRIVEHPALRLTALSVEQECTPQRLTRVMFDQAGETMRQVFTDQFEISFQSLNHSNLDNLTFEKRLKSVRTNSTGRREIFEQKG